MNILLFFWTLMYINLFTIGGGFAMIPLLEAEIVQHHHWLTHSEFVESIAVGQMSPGPLTIMNAFIGFKVFGMPGAVGAVLSTYLPSIVVVTIVAHYYTQVKNSVWISSAMKGITPVVIGLIASVGFSLSGSAIIDPVTGGIAFASLGILVLTKTDPSLIIIASGILGAIFL